MSSSNTGLHVVLGAGPAGTAIAEELAGRGLRVRHVARGPITGAPDGVETHQADLSTPEAAIAATEGASTIYHAVNVAYHLQVDLMPAIADSILSGAERHGAKLVVLDTLYPYGEADGDHITESTPWSATTRKGRLRAELDRRYLDAHESGTVRTVLGRSADFFGPGVLNSTLGGAFFPPALTGQPALALGDINLPHSYTYIRDVARGLVTLGTTEAGDGRVWHLPTVPAVSTAEVHRLTEDLIGRPLTVDVLAEAKPYGPFDETFMREYAEMFYQHLIPQNMVSTAFEDTFGVRPTPLREALADTIEWYSP
ncbi:NAD-dependent epimerase/dehydratase family protein [Phytoactinopolyspora halotolerans]|uniref:NAD-dependent epimerase/dehydratase family protein n=1 Tax=Phytoactinopolyspora halotolerans TaxID=1981512 RepID=A0A6L9SFV6_9ACTN|nr:NAD-dependent epimerase/dehydratase family protein [Phytoactinopolyspora halotolerans]NEE04003.1 NAD-dependent epimerase/dehydratase family protein [Phytoactinopolyspora halotolerans]